MTIIGLLRLLRKHLVLLLLTPVLLAVLVILFTKNPSFTYSSETTLYTGLASGSSVEMGKAISYFATNTDFDNLINVINSRETQQEVAIRLLAQHLMLSQPDPRYISIKAFDYLKKITTPYIRALIITSKREVSNLQPVKQASALISPAESKQIHNPEYQIHIVKPGETAFSISHQYGMNIDQFSKLNGIKENKIKIGQKLKVGEILDEQKNKSIQDSTLNIAIQDSTFSFSKLDALSQNRKMLPPSIDESAYEQTVKNLTQLCASSDTNFVSHLLSYNNPHYSIEAISSVNVKRIGSSDLVKLKYTSDDPGICQQTLILLTQVCIKNYKILKENRSDAVVKYFEYQVNQATQKLNAGEDKLLSFNKDNKIINYYEQSKAVAGAKEALDVDYNNMRIKLAGVEADLKRLEEKLAFQQKIQLKSAPIIEKRNQLSQIDTKIATAESIGYADTSQIRNLPLLKFKAEKLKDEIREAVAELYKFGNSTEGLPLATLLNEWIANVLKYEDLNAGLIVLGKRIQDFQKQYEIFAPAGANLKRIEREISVSESEFLELLHGLNLAKLKMQDLELSSNLKAIDQPFFPITPNPTKRKFLIIGAALFGILTVFSTIMAMEFFDESLRNPGKAAKTLKISLIGVFPKIYLKSPLLNFPNVTQRLLEMIIQNIGLLKKEKNLENEPFKILIFSTSNNEGKTVISQNIASQLKKLGNKVLVLRYAMQDAGGKKPEHVHISAKGSAKEYCPPNRFSIINWILGYSDNRIDYKSPFLCQYGSLYAEEDCCQFIINDEFLSVSDYKELITRDNNSSLTNADFVLIEIPSIIHYPYPINLIASVDLPLIVCRSNREWSVADQGSLDIISKITSHPPVLVLNGVEMEVMESILGEIPKKRSFLRRALKFIHRFQFNSKNSI